MMQCGTQKLKYQEATAWLSISHFIKDMLQVFRDLTSSDVAVYEQRHHKPFLTFNTRRV